MGYEYTIQGWFKSTRPIELSAVRAIRGASHRFVDHDRLDMWVRVTGRHHNFISFATQAKHRSNYYFDALAAIMEASGNVGIGLMTVTGEWSYDGKDRFVLANDGQLITVPKSLLYDPLSPWNSVYRFCHYMSRPVEALVRPDPYRLRVTLAERRSLKGWFQLPFNTSEDHANQLARDMIGREPSLEGGIDFVNQYMVPNLLFGVDAIDPVAIVQLLAEVSAGQKDAYGLLYFGDAEERTQVPVAIQDGRVLVMEEVAIMRQGDLNASISPGSAYEGLGAVFQVIALRSPSDLAGLNQEITRLNDATPVEPDGGLRLETGISGKCFLSVTKDLLTVLTANDGQTSSPAHAGFPYLLIVFAEADAEPETLKQRTKDIAKCLSAGGLDVGLDQVWPD